MDHIYPTKDYKEYVIKDEVRKIQDCLSSDDLPQSFEDISRIMDFSSEDLNRRSLELCRLYENYGAEESSDVPKPFHTFSKESLQLNSIQFLRRGNVDCKRSGLKSSIVTKEKCGSDDFIVGAIRPHSDCVITIRFYEPFKHTPNVKNQPRFHQEYQVLGSNFLTDLRDRFYCQCNYGPFFDISEDPTGDTCGANEKSTKTDPGFYYIHDTFYNDDRNPSNPDYSRSIINWMKKLSYARDFQSKSMTDTRFEDLRIRIGYPCVYMHHGACEHVFCITSVDLIDMSESRVASDYPRLQRAKKSRAVLCDICGEKDASYLVTECPLHVKDPMRLCDECFMSFHYIDGETKTCDFKAYRMHDFYPKN
jgi:snRNA-activating protein complex (SNAPc), subunit 3